MPNTSVSADRALIETGGWLLHHEKIDMKRATPIAGIMIAAPSDRTAVI